MIGESFNRQNYIDLRPLGQGIDLERPPHFLEKGFFLNIENMHLKMGSMVRRGSYSNINWGSLPTLDRKVYGAPLFFAGDGGVQQLLVTKKHLWRIEEDNGSERFSLLSAELRDDLTGSAVLLKDDLFEMTFTSGDLNDTEEVFGGDTVWLRGKPYEVVAVTSATKLIFRDHDGNFINQSPFTDVAIYKGFRFTPDWALYAGNFVFTDNSQRTLQVYRGTGSAVIYNPDPTAEDGVALQEVNTVAYFSDRLWIGGFTEEGVNERFRIRWSQLIFDPASGPAVFKQAIDFLDLPIGRYPLERLLPLGNLIVAYFKDRIFYGRPTNIIGLPYDFTPLDTGNVGLVGPRAITNWLDAHWFVGQENIYSLSATRALEPIGTRIVKETLFNPEYDLDKTIVTPDPIHERIVFQFFNSQTGLVTDIWSYFYKTSGWSIEKGPSRAGDIAVRGFFFGRTVSTKTWEDLEEAQEEDSSSWEDTNFFRPWSAFEPIDSPEKTFVLKDDGGVYLYNKDGEVDSYVDFPIQQAEEEEAAVISDSMVLSDLFGVKKENPIAIIVESGDFDFGSPNVLKTVTQLSVKLEEAVGEALLLDVWGTNNRQQQRKKLGVLRIAQGKDEGKIDFRMTGSLFRFEFRSSSRVAPWALNEIILLAQEVGREHVFV